jgi:hypothetical protein
MRGIAPSIEAESRNRVPSASGSRSAVAKNTKVIPRKTRADLHPIDREPFRRERALHDRQQPVDRVSAQPEEVEVAGRPITVTVRDQRRAARERESLGLGQRRDDRSDPQLKLARHLRHATMPREPRRPRRADRGWKHELIPHHQQLARTNVQADLVLGPLPQHLLLHTDPVGTIIQVVHQRRPAPADVQRKLEATVRPGGRRRVEITRNGNRTGRRPKPR